MKWPYTWFQPLWPRPWSRPAHRGPWRETCQSMPPEPGLQTSVKPEIALGLGFSPSHNPEPVLPTQGFIQLPVPPRVSSNYQVGTTSKHLVIGCCLRTQLRNVKQTLLPAPPYWTRYWRQSLTTGDQTGSTPAPAPNNTPASHGPPWRPSNVT